MGDICCVDQYHLLTNCFVMWYIYKLVDWCLYFSLPSCRFNHAKNSSMTANMASFEFISHTESVGTVSSWMRDCKSDSGAGAGGNWGGDSRSSVPSGQPSEPISEPSSYDNKVQMLEEVGVRWKMATITRTAKAADAPVSRITFHAKVLELSTCQPCDKFVSSRPALQQMILENPGSDGGTGYGVNKKFPTKNTGGGIGPRDDADTNNTTPATSAELRSPLVTSGLPKSNSGKHLGTSWFFSEFKVTVNMGLTMTIDQTSFELFNLSVISCSTLSHFHSHAMSEFSANIAAEKRRSVVPPAASNTSVPIATSKNVNGIVSHDEEDEEDEEDEVVY